MLKLTKCVTFFLLFSSSLISLAATIELESLGSTSAYYLDSIKEEKTALENYEVAVVPNTQTTENLLAPDSKVLLNIDYLDSYDKTIFSTPSLKVERLITVEAGGKEIRLDSFNLGLHIAMNYKL